MARSVEVFKESLLGTRELEREKELERQRKEEKHATMEKRTAKFSTCIEEIVDTVSIASAELNTTAQSMASIAKETNTQSVAVSVASNEASGNV